MKLAGRSEVQFHRYGTPSQIPRYRDTDSRLIAGDEISQPIRRKRTTEFVYCIQSGNGADAEVAGHEYNESNFSFHQYTNSATSLETICTRATTAKPKDDTDVIAAQKSTPRTGISSATSTSSIKQSSKRKPPFQPALTNSAPTVSLSFTTATAKSHRKKRVKKSGSGPVPNPPPTVFNVEHSSPLSGLVNLPSAPRPACSLDDTSPCDIDTLPSIPSPPGTMPQNNTTTTASFPNSFSYSASSAPFSTPYDDDALLENEIPFPLNKHSNIIIENMGVKKAKNLHKAKESLLNRYITTVRPDLPPHSGIADFETLPLRPLCQNKPAPSPSEDIPFQHCFSRPTTPGISTGPSSSKKDAWGCMHLGAADYELSLAFPHASHYEVWDMDDEAFFACPVFLCLMVKNPIVWTGTPISLPDASLIVIRCDDLPVPSSMSVYDPSIEYGVQCTVPQKSTWNRGPPSSCMQGGSPSLVDHDEITIDGKWERAYVRPKVQGRDGQTRIFRIADGAGNNNRNENGMVQGVNGRGWYLKFWIPIPARLFLKRETRIFEIRASVWMMGDEERVSGVTNLDGEEVDLPLVAETEMTVSHLRTERDMRKMY